MIHLLIAIVVVVLFLVLELGGAAAEILTINNQISRKALAGYLLAILVIYLVFNLVLNVMIPQI